MEYESKKIARKKYREANATISVTVSKDIKQMLDDMSLAENKSKAALINEMIMDRYNQQNNEK